MSTSTRVIRLASSYKLWYTEFVVAYRNRGGTEAHVAINTYAIEGRIEEAAEYQTPVTYYNNQLEMLGGHIVDGFTLDAEGKMVSGPINWVKTINSEIAVLRGALASIRQNFKPMGWVGPYMVTGIEGIHCATYDSSGGTPWPLTLFPNMSITDLMVAVSESVTIDTEANTINFGMGS